MSKPIRHGNKWRIRWTDENGKRCSETHGKKADARRALTRALVEVEERKRGLRALVPRSCTFREAASLWMEVVSGKRSRGTDESLLRVHLLPAFGDMQLLEINEALCCSQERQDARQHLSPTPMSVPASLDGNDMQAVVFGDHQRIADAAGVPTGLTDHDGTSSRCQR